MHRKRIKASRIFLGTEHQDPTNFEVMPLNSLDMFEMNVKKQHAITSIDRKEL